MWILLWVLLTIFLIVVTAWSLQILLRQKKAWAAYAAKHGLTYSKGTFMGPASMEGIIRGYTVSFFTAERDNVDTRKRKLVSVLEIQFNEGLTDGCAAGTQQMAAFMKSLDLLHPYKPKVENWPSEYLVFVKTEEVMDGYLNADRADALKNILATRNADVVVLFNESEAVIRLETSDPMQDAGKIDKIVDRLLNYADRLKL